jgi:hypothetical protein
MGLPDQFPELRKIQGYERYRNPRKSFTDKQINYRIEWLRIIKNNPDATRQELIDLNYFCYQWLRRNDSDWIEEYLPPVARIPRNQQLLNWDKLDRELYEKTEQAILKSKSTDKSLHHSNN